jgi:hypothetical protein
MIRVQGIDPRPGGVTYGTPPYYDDAHYFVASDVPCPEEIDLTPGSFPAFDPVRVEVLREAERLTCGDRNKDYGDPVDNHKDIAAGWSVLLDTEVSAQQVAMCMSWVKSCRTKTSPQKLDSYVDGAAYMAIAAECEDRA